MTGNDPLLCALAEARDRKQQADRDIRLLLAYAREHAKPRSYRLADLADAAGLSISGVRVAYTPADITHAAILICGSHGRYLEAVITTLLARPGEHDPAA